MDDGGLESLPRDPTRLCPRGEEVPGVKGSGLSILLRDVLSVAVAGVDWGSDDVDEREDGTSGGVVMILGGAGGASRPGDEGLRDCPTPDNDGEGV